MSEKPKQNKTEQLEIEFRNYRNRRGFQGFSHDEFELPEVLGKPIVTRPDKEAEQASAAIRSLTDDLH